MNENKRISESKKTGLNQGKGTTKKRDFNQRRKKA